jgi:peptidoglycan/LPS O-acetylase OafA/YrhL
LFMARLPYYLTLMPEYAHTDVFTIFVHSWIIGIETKFYVFFLLVVFLLIKSDAWRFGATAATAALLIAQGSFTAHAIAQSWPASCWPNCSNGRPPSR